MTIEKYDDGDEETERECVMCFCFMGFVKRVRFAEFRFVVFKLGLLLRREHCELPLFFWVFWVDLRGCRDRCVLVGKIVVVFEFG